jgi:hypothetical protein
MSGNNGSSERCDAIVHEVVDVIDTEGSMAAAVTLLSIAVQMASAGVWQ